MKEGYTEPNHRKKILMITDDIRSHSGVANIGREIVLQTAHKYNWVTIGGSLKHPEKGKRVDLSADTNKQAGIEDASVIVFPSDGYGDPDLLRAIIKMEKIDAIFLITDPRYFTWLFNMENELRKTIPIVYLNIWDCPPVPQYNREYYESCDLLMGISKQTKNINELALRGGDIESFDLDKGGKLTTSKYRSFPILLKYIPHGFSPKYFHPIDESKDSKYTNFKQKLHGGVEKDFTLLFNSRNIRRKQIPDTILAWKIFMDRLPESEKDKCTLILHTQISDDNGTDLDAVINYLCPDGKYNIKISSQPLSIEDMNILYNVADGVILLTSNEGWGLSLTEALLTGTPIIANVTGGMQDQMRFEDENGNWIDFDENIPSNHTGHYKKHGKWAFPVFPNNRSLMGSPPTPYIWDDRCTAKDAAEQIYKLYKTPNKKRKELGDLGRKWAISDEAGFTGEQMGERVMGSIDFLFKNWKPRSQFEFLKDTDYKPRVLNHKLDY